MPRTLSLGLALGLLAAVAFAQHDETRVPGASGNSVVESVADQLTGSCIFTDDKLFIRRLGYVESSDGKHPKTYRAGYDGGIWQMDEAMFDAIQTPASRLNLLEYIKDIQDYFGIDWPSATWSDCRKPLWSGIAARLYIEYKARNDNNGIPRDIPGQAGFWKRYYRTTGSVDTFKVAANQLEQGCTKSGGIDLMFVLDRSGSIGSSNFKHVRSFVADVIQAFDVTPDKTRVGVITYSTSVKTEWKLNTYTTKAQVVSAVSRIRYTGGGTNTHLGLEELHNHAFKTTNGARPINQGKPRVAIVMTDGKSAKPPLTVMSALRAHDKDITMFAIGVGSKLDLNELEAIASMPTCLHLFLLKGFSEIEALKSAIEKRTCEAPIIIGPGTCDNGTDGRIPAGGNQNCKIRVPTGGTTLKIIAKSQGKMTFFTAKDGYPSDAFFETKTESSNGHLGVVYVPKPNSGDDDGLVFCNIKGENGTQVDITIGCNPGDKDFCRPRPCKNEGTCVDEGDSYTCQCKPGFTGRHCETVINPCNSKPCKNGGVCTSSGASYVCTCSPSFSGHVCEIVVDHCKPNPCGNGACIQIAGGYTCKCHPGWTGKHCNTAIDKCASKPCVHGECKDLGNGYECCCEPGWTGPDCDVDIDECTSDPCVNGECVDGDNQYQCRCKPGWTGIHCEVEIDECASNPCVHGECEDRENGYVCTCKPGWTGPNCNIDIDECKSNPCINGECIDGVNKYTCICQPGWTGANCDINIDECQSNPCVNGACEDQVNGYICKCLPGWTGRNCDVNIDECISQPCVHGTCRDEINGYKCICRPGFTGTHCEVEIDECESNPCINGKCQDEINGYQCICDEGWTGKHCEINIDECASNPCEHGNCKDLINGYICTCEAGWTGTHCDCVIDSCASSPCKNGICENDINKYTCVCLGGFTGPTCEIEIEGGVDACTGQPCKNGGTCLVNDMVAGFLCRCPPGFTGKTCAVRPSRPIVTWDPITTTAAATTRKVVTTSKSTLPPTKRPLNPSPSNQTLAQTTVIPTSAGTTQGSTTMESTVITTTPFPTIKPKTTTTQASTMPPKQNITTRDPAQGGSTTTLPITTPTLPPTTTIAPTPPPTTTQAPTPPPTTTQPPTTTTVTEIPTTPPPPTTTVTQTPVIVTTTAQASCRNPDNGCVTCCEGIVDGHYQSCQGCTVYSSCGGGIFYIMQCAPTLVWDDKLKQCWPDSETCPASASKTLKKRLHRKRVLKKGLGRLSNKRGTSIDRKIEETMKHLRK